MGDQTAADRAAEVVQMAIVWTGTEFLPLSPRQAVAALMADPDQLIACARQAVAEGATIDADAVVDLAVEATSRSWVIEAIVGRSDHREGPTMGLRRRAKGEQP